MIVEVLAVGTEMLLGQIVNTNAAEIGGRLADAGLDHHHQSVVGDNLDRIVAAIRHAATRADVLIVTGGIGPTQDDLTREAIAAAAGVGLVFDEAYAAELEERFAQRGRQMPESNLRQAHRPQGADVIPNPRGTAPGLRTKVGRMWVFAVPGVPAEMLPMVDEHIVPFLCGLEDLGPSVVLSRFIRTWGESESRIGEVLADLYEASDNPTLAFLASAAEIKIRLTAKAATRNEALDLIAPVEEQVRARLGSRVFGADEETVERILFDLLDKRGWTIATAESATGGMIAARLTAVPGASAYFRGSVVAYDVDVKRTVLDVPDVTIDEFGVVSEEVALAMAQGGAGRLGADVVIAVTGSAGPDEQERPVGTMIVAVRTPDGAAARTLRMPGDRERVRTYTTTAALHLARLAVQGAWWRDDRENIWVRR